MSIIAWIVLGLISGSIASKVVHGRSQDLFMDMALGVLGALVGGVMFHLVGRTDIAGFDLPSVFASALGGVTVLVFYYALSGRRSRA